MQAHKAAAQPLRHHLGELGLADAGLALEEQRAAHVEGQEDRDREAALGDIVPALEQRERLIDRRGEGGGGGGQARYAAARGGASVVRRSRPPRGGP